jgi:hypothetical protein
VSTHLIGGGRDEAQWPALYTAFLHEATDRGRIHGFAVPTIAVIVVHAADDEPAGAEAVARFTGAVTGRGPANVRPLIVVEGDQLHPSGLHGC